jgi:catechol-2,3-dioxygenase
MGVSPVRLNHAVLYVSDVSRSVAFYTSVLGMRVVTQFPGAAFLVLPRSGNDHDLGMFEVGGAGVRRRGGIGLYHLAWQVDLVDELVEARATLQDAGALVGESDHGTTKSLYAVDPDGIEFEMMWMVPRAEWAEFRGLATAPLDLAAVVARWSGVPTGAELVPLP